MQNSGLEIVAGLTPPLKALLDPTTLIDRGREEYMVKTKTSASYQTMPCPISNLSCEPGDICNKLHQLFQTTFFMIVAWVPDTW